MKTQQWAVTFGQRYNHEAHPADSRITGHSFVVFEGTEAEAREAAHKQLDRAWAFMYLFRYADGVHSLDFQRQITEYDLRRVDLKEASDGAQ